MDIRICLAQMDVVLGQPEQNLAIAKGYIRQAVHHNGDLILFPELWTTGYDLENCGKHALYNDQELIPELIRLAVENHISIGGSYIRSKKGNFYNSFVMISAQGEIIADYDKVHLFSGMREPDYFEKGDQLVSHDLGWGLCGLAICYDLRFPEMFRKYALNGAIAVAIVAEWPEARITHWKTLLQARAIENQIFILAVNRIGISNDERFGGCSAIIGPGGQMIALGGSQANMIVGTINTEDVNNARTWLPVLLDRRSDIYGI